MHKYCIKHVKCIIFCKIYSEGEVAAKQNEVMLDLIM